MPNSCRGYGPLAGQSPLGCLTAQRVELALAPSSAAVILHSSVTGPSAAFAIT
jgi:hypothetical protein